MKRNPTGMTRVATRMGTTPDPRGIEAGEDEGKRGSRTGPEQIAAADEGGAGDHPAARLLGHPLDADAEGQVVLFPGGDHGTGKGDPQHEVADVVGGGPQGGHAEQPRDDGDCEDQCDQQQEQRGEGVLRGVEDPAQAAPRRGTDFPSSP